MTGMMQAVRIDAPGTVTLARMPAPLPAPDEVRLRLTHVGYCGSDLSSYLGRNPMVSFPRLPGHEIAAIVDQPGSGVSDLAAGQSVTVLPYFNCGACVACRKGRPNACRDNQTMGVQREGAMSEYVCVPRRYVIPVKGLAQRDLALIEPIAVGFHAAARADIQPGESVAVLGCGMIGLGVLLGARARGARVIAVDIADGKLELAGRLGAETGVNAAREDVVAHLRALTGDEGPSVIIEAAGAAATFRQAVEAVAPCGRVVYVGYTKTEVAYETRLFPMKEIEIYGSRGATFADFDAVIGYFRAHPDLAELADRIVTRMPRLDTAPDAMRDWARDPGAITKIIIDMGVL